ncbi:MAG: helix-turn-helix transcriptional regulator [Pseudomonadota bacterium]
MRKTQEPNVTAEKSPTRQASPIDALVGRQIRLRRNASRINLETLANAIGCSTQQLRKYETAENRISAGMLARVSRALAVHPAYFFDGYEMEPDDVSVPILTEVMQPDEEGYTSEDASHLMACAQSISDANLRQIVANLAELAETRF